MNMDLSESINLISGLKSALKEKKLNCNVVICPPYISLDTARELVKESDIELGAQNMYFEDSGAYTGEISAEMLKSVGCKFVILGHSERRTIFGETDELINKKVHKAILSKLIPIFCFGETLEERESNRTFDVVKKQVVEGLKGVLHSQMDSIILAYEPVWAIGTGKTATPDQAEEVHKFVRNLLEEMYNKETADGVVIQYGGSVKPDNAYELLHMPNIDGALVGGACLKAESFVKIIEGC